MAAYNSYVALREAATRACEPYDFVLSPTSPILPYEAELPAPGNDPHNALPHIAFTVPYNMSEQPAASLNWTFSKDGLPIGVQVIGKRFDDLGVLRLSRALEQLGRRRRPGRRTSFRQSVVPAQAGTQVFLRPRPARNRATADQPCGWHARP